MKKKVVILLLISLAIIFVNIFLIVNYSGVFVTTKATAQGTISLTIEGACGDGSCNGGEDIITCATDCTVTEETPAPSGGGGGSAAPKRDFSIDKSIVKVMVRQGESFKTSIRISNPEKQTQKFELSVSESLRKIVFLSDELFSLGPGEEKTIDLNFVSGDYIDPAVYTGHVIVKTQSITKKVSIIDSIKSKMVLFDVSLDIPAKYKEVLPGDEVLLQVTLFNLGEVGKTDVTIEYLIKDFEGDTIIEESEIVAVETQVSFSKMVKLPSTVKPGDYVAIAQARYDASLGSSSAMFHVMVEELEIAAFYKNKYFFVVLVILVLLVLFVILLTRERKKMRNILKIQTRELRKISDRVRSRKIAVDEAKGIRGKLSRQLSALKKAFSEGYISRDSYEKGKRRIQNLGNKLKSKCL